MVSLKLRGFGQRFGKRFLVKGLRGGDLNESCLWNRMLKTNGVGGI